MLLSAGEVHENTNGYLIKGNKRPYKKTGRYNNKNEFCKMSFAYAGVFTEVKNMQTGRDRV